LPVFARREVSRTAFELANTTRRTCGSMILAIANAFAVASSATSSVDTQTPREQLQRCGRRLNPPRRPHRAVIGDRDLAEVAMPGRASPDDDRPPRALDRRPLGLAPRPPG
jgi:hypothetical protein